MDEQARRRSRQALDQVLDGQAALHAAEVQVAEGLVDLARHYAVDQDELIEHLAEKRYVLGSHGCPEVSEFLTLEVGAALGLTETGAGHLLVGVLNLYYRHRLLWAAFVEGKIRRWQADKLTDLCRDLDVEAAAKVDERIAARVGRVSFPRLRKLTAGWVAQADPTLAAAKERQQRRARQVDFFDHMHGSSTIFGRIATADARALEHSVREIATRLAEHGDERSWGERRAAALGMLADPATAARWLTGEELDSPALRRRAIVYVHLPAEAVASTGCPGVARIEGMGALTTESLPEFLRGTHVTVRPVLDPSQVPATHRYEIPDALREAVVLRHPFEVFPFSARESRGLDMDHTVPWRRDTVPASTRLDNLAPLSGRVHRAKTAGVWQLQRVGEQGFKWLSPLNYRYLTDAAGTQRLPQPP